ncbi:hydrolase [Actinoplanes sp. SE50]|uniref:alpha/beta fold hydrolase n=1 Tax=unclassified Actinoplanes TaxID=2626549 RepID=UPI00023EBB9D|nr:MULTISPECIES: alpha/beta hydrolase [unclassified Actinoplanes]AEV84510.1 Abhydrolase domain-containing protein 11 [Actinoplanes sp. SE50/110]ATO82902.1 hydrolase [Actinoplanes sp. SE50]SLM00310.1 hydrolase [Actinoplanes sp. SE50/110]
METVTSRDGTTIAFDRYGDGPPVVLVGGAFQHRWIDQQTARLGELLAQAGLSALHYDRRGRGDSGDTPPYAVDRELEDIDALLEAAGGSAMLFGMSSGAALALRAAATGRPVERVAVYEPPFRAGADPETTAAVIAAAREGRRADAVRGFMRLTGMPDAMIDQVQQSPGWAGLEAVAPTLAYDLTIMGNGDVPVEVLAAVKVPVLAMDGGASPPWAGEAAAAVASGVADGRRQTLPDQTHGVDPEVLAPALIDFCR